MDILTCMTVPCRCTKNLPYSSDCSLFKSKWLKIVGHSDCFDERTEENEDSLTESRVSVTYRNEYIMCEFLSGDVEGTVNPMFFINMVRYEFTNFNF